MFFCVFSFREERFILFQAMNVDTFNIVTLNLGKAVRNGDWIYVDVCSPFARIYYIVSGTAAVEMMGKKYTLHPRHLYLIPPFVKHSTTCKGTFVHYYVHLYEDELSGVGVFDEFDLPLELKATGGDRQLFERLVQLNPTLALPYLDPKDYDNKAQLAQTITRNKQRPEWVKLETRGIVLQICSHFMGKAKPKPYASDERIVRTIRYIHDHLSEHISIQQLSDEAKLSPGHFIRLFEQGTGMSPKMFINMKRIERAQHLLHATKLPVREVALRLGFPDNSYFVRVFKRNIGMTPVEYRNHFTTELEPY